MKPPTLRNALKEILTKEELEAAKTSYDIVGDILILDIPDALRHKEMEIGQIALSIHKNVNTVLRKEDVHEGKYRTQKLVCIAGEDKRITLYKENGYRLMVDVENVYFSARLAHERERVAELIQDGEEVLVLFSGCNPYCVAIAKNANPKKVVCIEWNPTGVELGRKNIELNKLTNVETIEGDVREVAPTVGKFDRVLMCLPKDAEEFLDVAIPCVKKGGILQMYKFLHKDEVEKYKETILDTCKTQDKKGEIVNVVACGQHAPYIDRYCFDVKIN